MIRKLLVANRGEIACRVIESAQGLGIATVAVYSDADANARHVALAGEAVRLGPAPVSESYLKSDAIVAAARATGADAIHPGYGFLSENPEFVEAVEAAGLIFVGPSVASIRAMGLKDKAKALMEAAGVPVVPGYHGADQDPEVLARAAGEIGYPVMIKARAGGGGKGMRLVETPEAFPAALESAAREAEASFGDPVCLIEKYIQSPRHIEVQVFGDAHGNVVHLFERDCSLQRRHQKVIEEAPAPGMTEGLRASMGAAAVSAAKAVDYVGAGTVEFIVDGAAFPDPKAYWFMEMNTRLQVEHPVTEAITGLDLVAVQLSVAEGAALPFAQEELTITGHAIEARLYAEDPGSGFLPSTGTLDRLHFASGARVDTGVRQGDAITSYYDPMISKIIAHAPTRDAALRQLAMTLEGTAIAGLETNRDFLIRLARDADFGNGNVDTGLIERKGAALVEPAHVTTEDFALAALAGLHPEPGREPFAALSNYRHFGPARQIVLFKEGEVIVETTPDARRVTTPMGAVEVSDVKGKQDAITVIMDGQVIRARVYQGAAEVVVDRDGGLRRLSLVLPGGLGEAESADSVQAPLTGRVVDVSAEVGQHVSKGDPLMVIEAMKMEHRLTAPRDGIVAEVGAETGAQVDQGAVLIRLEAEA